MFSRGVSLMAGLGLFARMVLRDAYAYRVFFYGTRLASLLASVHFSQSPETNVRVYLAVYIDILVLRRS